MVFDPDPTEPIHALPNSTYVVETRVGRVLVHCPPETLKELLAHGLTPPTIILLPPDIPPGQQIGSSGFVHQGINYASVEFLLYTNFFGRNECTTLITPTKAQARRIRQLLIETISGPEDIRDYGPTPWLQQECAAVGYSPALGRAPSVDDLAHIISLEEQGGLEGLDITIEGDYFTFYQDGEFLAAIPTIISDSPRPLTMAPARPLLRHELTVQFIGGSDGFDPFGITTCFLAYLGKQGATRATLFDTAAYLRMRLGALGVSPPQISEVVLSHLHEDHLAGLPELLLMGSQRVRLLTADVIHTSLLHVLSAMLDLPEEDVGALFDYYPLNPGEPVVINGRHFESIYAVHSIPTIAVRAESLCYSGDMRYDEVWFDELVEQGVLSPERRDALVNFADGAQVLVQDAGGGPVHTTITPETLKSLTAKSQRVILAHTSNPELLTEHPGLAAYVEIAHSGHISAMGDLVGSVEADEWVETLSACPLFARLPLEERVLLVEKVKLAEWEEGETIIYDGEPVDGFTYVVHSGLAEIWINGTMLMAAGRGSSIGERGVLLGGDRSSTIIARGHVQLLGLSSDIFQPIAERLGLRAALERADWLWKQPLFKTLLWATLLDLALDFQPQQFQAGDVLFGAGEPGEECYLLVQGTIRLTTPTGDLLTDLTEPGEFFGGLSAFYHSTRSATAQALILSEVWVLPTLALQRLQMVYPNILFHLRMVESNRRN
ncbi:MAG: cyclic nucleotide-binding domain-containing protein [Ardenticatenales bacterium]|nr:cyclic nucleotide-binding domain-containing protein [Ardenticatenales bacterium]